LETFKEIKALKEGSEQRENASDPSLTRGGRDKRRHSRIWRKVPLVERVLRGAPSFRHSYIHSFVNTHAHVSLWMLLRARGAREESCCLWACH
jgi:hypothetical protein